ncbi:MAG TPA: PDZ domain-containing protein, partial [Gemmataceae bacterium]|nr:PDZ domain-containing protein [Gemmataceae bacterium]
REEKRAIAAFAELAKGGAIDCAVEKFVRRDRWEDETACWKVLADLEDKLTDLERQAYGKPSRRQPDRRLKHNSANMAELAHAAGLPPDGAGRGTLHLWEKENRWVLRAEEVQKGKRFFDFLVALSGGAFIRGEFAYCAIFSCGSIACNGVDDSLIVCDGDFTAQGHVSSSLVIARGTISCGGGVTGSRLISCGQVRLKYPQAVTGSKVVEKEPRPLGFVKFFDPADVGITVEPADGGARVKSAEKGKPFAEAGVRAGDLITAVNGQAVKDAESFRRLLRASLAVDGETVLKVRRDKQVSEVRVPAPK